jgi:hypothetical protein
LLWVTESRDGGLGASRRDPTRQQQGQDRARRLVRLLVECHIHAVVDCALDQFKCFGQQDVVSLADDR